MKKRKKTKKMNKKGLIKWGVVSVLVLILVFLLLIIIFSVSSSAITLKKEYEIGKKIKLDLKGIENYRIKIITPSDSYVMEGSNEVLAFKPEETGHYSLIISYNNKTDTSEFEVVDSVAQKKDKKQKPLKKENTEKNNRNFKEIEELKEPIEVGKPVRWRKLTKNRTIELPDAVNVSVKTLNNKSITGLNLIKQKDKNILEIKEAVPSEEELEIEYYTEAPKKQEKEISETKKEVLVYSSQKLNYTNISAFTNISEITSDKKAIKIYWKEYDTYLDFQAFDTNGNGLLDYVEWTIPELQPSNQTFEISITVLNIQSYPIVGGNWKVNFNTIGKANLTIRAVNGTIWSNLNENNDLKFLELKCGNKVLNYEWINDSVFVQDYFCNETSSETSKVLTEGKHHLEFSFGNQKAYAHNNAGSYVLLGETGSVDISGFQSHLIAFKNKYSSLPIVIASPVSQNFGDDNYIIPTIFFINETHFNVSLCRDTGEPTCNTTGISETLHYFVFDVNASLPNWIDIGTATATTNGASTAISFNKVFSNAPYVWVQSQKYNQTGTNMAATAWVSGITTSGAIIHGCTHQGTSNACDSANPSEIFAWVAIDVANANFSSGVNFQTGSVTVNGPTWSPITWNATYTNPRMMVTIDGDSGGQDPKYPWARDITTSTPDVRQCEQDGYNVCDKHLDNPAVWFTMEQGDISIGVDNNPPLVTIIDPQNKTYTSLPILFNISVDEPATALYSFDGGITNISMTANSSSTGFTASNNSIADGSYTVNYYVNDSFGNRNDTEKITFSIDTTPLNITIISPQPINYTVTSVNFNITLDETGSACSYSLDGGATNISMSTTDNLNYNATNSSIGGGLYTVNYYCNDTVNNIADISRDFGINVLTISVIDFYALNSSLGRINSLNTSNLEEIEYLELNFSITSSIENIDSWYFNFTANGTNSCSLGNKQSSICYNFSNSANKWIQFINGTNTATYDGTKYSQGDNIIVTKTGGGSQINISLRIDEHYNPNVFKWYDSLFNFSDVKWQNGTNERITSNNLIKITINQSLVPLDADQYKIDIRVNYSSGTTEELHAHACNSSYTTGDIHTASECTTIIAQKFPDELQDDGTKFRGIITKNSLSGIGDWKYIVFHHPEINNSKYYSIKTYKALTPSYTTHWEYSTDMGTTWNNSNDGYETDLNINWFYDGADPTAFIYNFWANSSSGLDNFNIGNITWDIDPTNNYPPLSVIVKPQVGDTISLPYNIIISSSDPNDDNLNVSLFLYQGGVLNKTLVTDMNQSNMSYLWNGPQQDGNYNLTIEACELGTPELYCINETHAITLDSTPPSITISEPQNINYTTNNLEINFSVSDSGVGVESCWYTDNNGATNITITNCQNTSYTASQGSTTLIVYSNDTLDNTNSSNVTFFVDSLAPIITFELPTRPNGTSWEFNYIYVNVSINETNFANMTYELYNETSLVNRTTYFTPVSTINWTGLNNNNINYYYNVSVVDILNNENFTETRILTLTPGDIQAPIITIISPESDGINYSVSYLDFNVSLDEIGSACSYSLDGGATNISMSTTDNINYIATNSSIADGQYTVDYYCNDTSGNMGSSSRGFGIDTHPPIVSNLVFYSLNSSLDVIGNETSFNSTNLPKIEFMRVNFTLTDNQGLVGDISAFYTGNGSNTCVLGNLQSNVCYSYPDFIEVRNGTNTSLFDANRGVLGDLFNCSYAGSATERNYSCLIDYHYNPNLYKHYPFNFSDVKWQDGAGERIWEGNLWKIEINQSIVPLDADQYKIDFHVNYTSDVTHQLEVHVCNSSYVSGHPHDSPECPLIGSRYPNELVDDGTKFRAFFTKAMIENMGDLKYILIESSEGEGYYTMKTFKYEGTEQVRSSTSIDNGGNYTLLSNGYETDLNLNWYYDNNNSNATQLILKIQSNDVGSNLINSSEYAMTWNITRLNIRPSVDLKNPSFSGQNISGEYLIGWIVGEPNGDSYTTNITLMNSTDTIYIASNLSDSISDYSWNSSEFSDGTYNLTIESCENETAEGFCGSAFHIVNIDNSLPVVYFVDSAENITDNTEDSWNYSGTPTNTANAVDEDFSTYALIDSSPEADILYINYTIPDAVSGAVLEYLTDWQLTPGTFDCYNSSGGWDTITTMADNIITNTSILSDCLSSDILQLRAYHSLNPGDSGSVNFYEEQVHWQIEPLTYPNGANISKNFISANVIVNELHEANITFNLFNSTGDNINSTTFTDGTRLINWTGLSEGTYTYNISVTDYFNNQNSTETRTITLDTTAPNGTLLTPLNGTYQNNATQNLTLNATDNINLKNATLFVYNETDNLINQTTVGVSGTEALVGIVYKFLYDGIFKWFYRIFDIAGNTFDTENNTIKIDTTYPLIDYGVGTEPNGTEIEQNFIYVNVSVTEINEANITFRLFNSTSLINESFYNTSVRMINWTDIPSLNVTYYYNVSVVDLANNINSTQTREVTLIDTKNPGLTLVNPQNTSYDYNESIALNYIVNDANLETCWYSLDGGVNTTLSNCANTTFSVADGSHTLYLYANDSFGFINSTSVTFVANSSLIITNNWIVQRGSVSSVDGQQNVSIEKVDRKKSFILHTQRTSDSGPDSLFVLNNFVNSTMIQFENYNTGAGAIADWEVITGPSLNVQRGIQGFGATDLEVNVSLSNQVNISDSFLVVSTRLNSGTTTDNQQGRWTGKFFNETLIILRRGVSGTAGEISWQAVEWKGANVQNGSFSASALSGTSSLASSVNLSNSFLIFSSTADGGTTLSLNNIGGFLANSNTVSFYRNNDDAGSMYAEWFVVESPLIDVKRGSFLVTGTTNEFLSPALINESRTFNRASWDSTGNGNTHANAILSTEIIGKTIIRATKGTSSQTQNVSWQTIEIIELSPPIINLLKPLNDYNFSSYTISQFNYSVSDNSTISNCSLYGNWSGVFTMNQTIQNPSNNGSIIQNFSSINTGTDGYYIWNVECTDVYNNIGRNSTNWTFAAFLPPEKINSSFFNITQTSNDGFGNITLFWNSSNHSIAYQIYYNSSLNGEFSLLNETSDLNFTDTTFSSSGEKRRFYRIDAWNPTGKNSSSEYFGVHIYSLSHNGNTRNWISFPSNASYLKSANDSLNEIRNATAFTMFNSTIQKKVTCNKFSCPEFPSCTETNCNFGLSLGIGYEVNINSSAPNSINWSLVGVVYGPTKIHLIKNATDFGKNWIAIYANTTLSNAQSLLENITNSDSATNWDSQSQTSQGLIPSPFPWIPYLGTNFNLEIEKAYEVSVTQTTNWTQV